MPKPSNDELRKNDKDGYMHRCIPAVIKEGADQKQASGKCLGMWNSAKEDMELELGLTESVELEAVRRNFRKDVIYTGNFVHPTNGKRFTMTPERLQRLERNVHRMRKNGVNIPIYHGHDQSKPLGNIGNAMIDSDRLMLDHEFADDDAVTLAKRAKFVSIKTNPNYVDCHGNEYGEVIEHVAITAEPVITGQGEFLKLSRETEAGEQTNTEVHPMLPKVLEKLGLPADADEATVLSRIDEVANPAPVQLSMEVVGIVTEAIDTRLSGLVDKSKLSPACAKALKLALVGEEGKENVLCLSGEAIGQKRSLANQVIDILEKNEPVDMTERTGAQAPEGSVTLSRKESKDEESGEKLSREAIDKETDRLAGLVNNRGK